MNEFLFKGSDQLSNLRASQLVDQLMEAEAKAETQSDLNRLRRTSQLEAMRAELAPTALWDQTWDISANDLPQKALIERFVEKLSNDMQALYLGNALFRDQLMRSYNMIVGDLARASSEAQHLADQTKLLSLQLGQEMDVDYYTDALTTSAGLDERSTCQVDRGATLARTGTRDLMPQAKLEIVDQGGLSNGLPGNKHEVTVLKREAVPTFGAKQETVEFVGKKDSHAALGAVTDGSFDTWFEYEILEFDRFHAGNTGPQLVLEDVFGGFGLRNSDIGKTLWLTSETSLGEKALPLRLVLRVDLQEVTEVNWLQVVPYIPDGGFGPALEKVETSADGLSWQQISRAGGDLSHLNRKLGSIVQGAKFGTTNVVSEEILRLPSARARYLKIYLRADDGYPTMIGHTYYEKKARSGNVRTDGPDQGVPDLPYVAPSGVSMAFEAYPGKRFMIGLREIGIRSYDYAATSELLSKPIVARGGRAIDRVTLLVDDEVPIEWWGGDFKLRAGFVRYFLSKDGGNTWSALTPDGSPHGPGDPPQFLAMGPDEDVRALRLKAMLTRPGDSQGTPIVRRMALKLELRP